MSSASLILHDSMLPAITHHPTSCQNAPQLPLVSDRAVFSMPGSLSTTHGSPGHSSLGVRTSPATVNHENTLFNHGEAEGFQYYSNASPQLSKPLVFLTFLPSPVHCPPMHQPTFNCLFRMTCSMSPTFSVTQPKARPPAAQSSSAGLCLPLETRREEAHPGRSTWGETG